MPSTASRKAHLARRLSGRAQAVLAGYQEHFRRRESSTVLQAKQYVADHFAEDVSLNYSNPAKQIE